MIEAAAASIAGGLINSALGFAGQNWLNQRSYDFNANEAQKQRDFEEYMSSSAYQRAVADMKAAGINPGVALSQGASQSSTPTGAAAHGSSGQMINPNINLSSAFLNMASRDKSLAQKYFEVAKASQYANALEVKNNAQRDLKSLDKYFSKQERFEAKKFFNSIR